MFGIIKKTRSNRDERKIMIRNNRILYCTVNGLHNYGFSRRNAKILMNQMKKDYLNEGYLLFNKQNKIPMSYALKWVENKHCVNLSTIVGAA